LSKKNDHKLSVGESITITSKNANNIYKQAYDTRVSNTYVPRTANFGDKSITVNEANFNLTFNNAQIY
jgi:hypothetical protein